MIKEKQGVMGKIEFPLGQDEIAISKAIGELLEEGWIFEILTKTTIVLRRQWEYDSLKEIGETEFSPKQNKSKK